MQVRLACKDFIYQVGHTPQQSAAACQRRLRVASADVMYLNSTLFKYLVTLPFYLIIRALEARSVFHIFLKSSGDTKSAHSGPKLTPLPLG